MTTALDPALMVTVLAAMTLHVMRGAFVLFTPCRSATLMRQSAAAAPVHSTGTFTVQPDAMRNSIARVNA